MSWCSIASPRPGHDPQIADQMIAWTLRNLPRLGYGAVVQGCAHVSRLVHRHRQARHLAEAALTHVVGNAVVRAYQRSDLMERRRVLMEQWAAFLTQPPAVVVPLRSRSHGSAV
jgi:hypothetical protein